MGLVNKQRSPIKTSLILADDRLARMSDFELDLLVHLISDIIEAFLDENDLIDII